MSSGKGAVEVYLKGGLGNQMFQWAAGYSFAKRINASLILNASSLGSRKFELNSFAIGKYELSNKKSIVDEAQGFFLSKILRIILSRNNYFERSFNFEPRFLELKKSMKIHGFFQSKAYFAEDFSDIKTKLSQLIAPSLKYYDVLKYIQDSPTTAVHIRRGDYLKNSQYHGLLNREYYSVAISELKKRGNFGKIMVFSDDVDSARNIFPHADRYLGPNDIQSSAENLLLMSKCGALVGANSSFSLWASLLMGCRTDFLIFPRPWFKSSRQLQCDPVPINLTRIDVTY